MARTLCYRCGYPIETEYVEVAEVRENLLKHYHAHEIPASGKIWFTLCGQCGMFRHQLGEPTRSKKNERKLPEPFD